MSLPPPVREGALSGYYLATFPWRWLRSRSRVRRQTAPIMILFYHRVADEHPNPWTISTSRFERHLDWLGRHFEWIGLGEARRRIRSGGNSRPAVCITFDDGYAENCDFAIPELLARHIPCTYFVTTRHVLENQPFPHDVAAGRALPPNTRVQLEEMASAGIEIGHHTRTHPDVGALQDPVRLADELVTSRDELAQTLGRPIHDFAFPFGLPQNLSRSALTLARQAGYRTVCSAFGGYNWPGDDGFHLLRIHGDPELIRLKNWLTVDPRKERRSAPEWTRLPESEGVPS